MRTVQRGLLLITIAIVGLLLSPLDSYAYIGPGAGITALGTLIAFVGAIIFAIIGFVWYPIKRLLAFFKNKHGDRREAQEASLS